MQIAGLNSVGVMLKITVSDENGNIVALDTASVKQLIFRKPDNTTITKNAVFYTDGTDGILQYTTGSGFLDIIGIWEFEPYIEIDSKKFTGNSVKFLVKP